MTLRRSLSWGAGALLAPFLLALLLIAVFGWNWLRGPIERMALEKTGRVLEIGGDISVSYAWPRPSIHVGTVSFANPGWAKEKQMVSAQAVVVAIDLLQLLRRRVVFPEVHLKRPLVFLEQSGGRKNWLLDREQTDEDARIRIDRLTLDDGRLGYDDAAQQTSIRADLSTPLLPTSEAGVRFTALGRFKGQPLKASGVGGPVLGLRDEQMPYAVQVDLSVGHTHVKASGTITSLLRFYALDMRLALRGESLAQLYPLLGIALPETRAYSTDGRLTHSGQSWNYEGFSGRFGGSDLAGRFSVDTGGKRPAIQAGLVSRSLDIADLGVLAGAQPGRLQDAKASVATAAKIVPASASAVRLLPSREFKADTWKSVDAQVALQAGTLRGTGAVALVDLKVHLSLIDSVLLLDPLDFALAGGQIKATVSLDGRSDPIQARVQVSARRIALVKLFPSAGLNGMGKGQFNGDLALAGNGDSVGRMLGSSNGKLRVVIEGGEVSQMMMEKAGLHLWEILLLSLGGDRLIKLRCGVADFNVQGGVMDVNTLILDSEVSTIVGSGSIDLRQERLDLTLKPRTKNTSPLALRSPIYVRGSFANPVAGVDKAQVAARALGALALGLVNPLFAVLPLIDAGPGRDGDCSQQLQAAHGAPALQRPLASKETRRQ